MNAKVSVIITTYNDAELLERAIKSVISQSLIPSEILIIDDGSSSNEAKNIVNKYLKFNKIKIFYFKKENGGPSSARNYGLQKSKYEFIVFLDADDEMTKNSIKDRYEIITKLDDKYAAVYGNAFIINNNKLKKQKFKILKDYLKENKRLIGRGNGLPGGVCYYMFRKRILNELGGLNINLTHNEDFEIILKIAKNWKFYGIKKYVMKIHIRNNSLSRINYYNSYYGVEKFLEIAKKNNLFCDEEIVQRQKENKLFLIKKIILNEGFNKKTSKLITEAFKILKPKSLKEYVIYIYNKLFLIFN